MKRSSKPGRAKRSPKPPAPKVKNGKPGPKLATTPDAEREPMETMSRSRSQSTDDFTIVGIGASAGGLEALEEFLKNVPTRSGMAYVIVQHLDPTHKGMLVELLQRATEMPVVQAQDRAEALVRDQEHVEPADRVFGHDQRRAQAEADAGGAPDERPHLLGEGPGLHVHAGEDQREVGRPAAACPARADVGQPGEVVLVEVRPRDDLERLHARDPAPDW